MQFFAPNMSKIGPKRHFLRFCNKIGDFPVAQLRWRENSTPLVYGGGDRSHSFEIEKRKNIFFFF